MIEREIAELLRKIPFKVRSVVLFGSHARGEALPWSDVDVLFISDDFSGMRMEDRLRPILENWSYKKPIEPVCLSLNEISEENPLIWEICADGIVIVDDGTFHEIRERCVNYMKSRKIERKWYGYVQL
ncbi:MAG: nucleotidyltransferase domain-containing protein [Candidatus Methanodesulfokora sp.]|mgnify:CR=1 FL=1